MENMNKIEKAIKELEKIQARFEESDPVYAEIQEVIDLLNGEASENTVPNDPPPPPKP